MAQEIGYPARIPSNLIRSGRRIVPIMKSSKLKSWFVTGFRDAERSFMIKFTKVNNRIQLDFIIGLHLKDLPLLYLIKDFFGVGNVRYSKNRCSYSVTNLSHILNVIIPHFEQFPLQTQKKISFLLFVKAARLMKKKVHLTENGVQTILNIKAASNWGLSRALLALFSLTVRVRRPIVDFMLPLDPYWVRGFTSGDGSFIISIVKNKDSYRIRLKFNLIQDVRDEGLLRHFLILFGFGTVRKNSSTFVYEVSRLKDIERIVKYFSEYSVGGTKYDNFYLWVKVYHMIKNQEHLTKKGIDEIIKIKENQK